jgi:hypothetical protein
MIWGSGSMEVTWKLDGMIRVGGLADDWGRIPDTGFLGETRCHGPEGLTWVSGLADDSGRIPDTGFLGETRCHGLGLRD